MGWKWTDARELGERLYDLHPETHPLAVRFTDLHAWIVALDGFDDDPGGSTEGHLESVQMVWYEEWQEDHDPAEDPYRYVRS
jgi:FeS assembly protein IscX